MSDLALSALTEAANKRLRAQGLGAPYVAPAALQNIVGAVLEALPREWALVERLVQAAEDWLADTDPFDALDAYDRERIARMLTGKHLDLLAAEGWRQAVGRCQASGPRLMPGAETPGMAAWCQLAAGHTGAHREGTAEWTERGPAREALVADRDRLRAALTEVIEVLRTSRGAGDAARVAREALDAPAGHTQPLGDGTGAP